VCHGSMYDTCLQHTATYDTCLQHTAMYGTCLQHTVMGQAHVYAMVACAILRHVRAMVLWAMRSFYVPCAPHPCSHVSTPERCEQIRRVVPNMRTRSARAYDLHIRRSPYSLVDTWYLVPEYRNYNAHFVFSSFVQLDMHSTERESCTEAWSMVRTTAARRLMCASFKSVQSLLSRACCVLCALFIRRCKNKSSF
jgi:hypothetical protein